MSSPAGRWLVDGLNVLGSRPDGWWRDRRAAMRRLVAALDAYAEATGDELTVVFDGRPFQIADQAPGAVRVAFARRGGRDAADDEIVRRVAGDRDAADLTVVTSDASLARRVEGLGASVTGSGGFRRRLEQRRA